MNTKQIQQVLRTIHRESLKRSAAIRSPHTGEDLMALYKVVASEWAEYARPAPGRTTLAFANLSFEEQEQIERYAQQLINEAQALVLHLQERCPMLLYGTVDEEDLYSLERWYRAQYHAMERLRRRWDDGQWVRSHIKKARKWMEEAYVESVN